MKRFLLITSLLAGFSFANYYFDYVMCRYLSDRPKEAELYCLQAIEEKPTPSLYMDTIRLEVSLKNTDRALKLAREYIRRYPDRVEPYIALYSIYRLKGDRRRALSRPSPRRF